MIMNKKFFSILLMMLLGLFINLSVTSCNNDPDVPKDETEDKDHDDPAKIVLTLASGHFHGNHFHQDAPIEGLKYMNAVQTITYEMQAGKGMVPIPGSADRFVVMSGSADKAAAYGLWIKYYDKDGKEITGHFIENGQDKLHQHFFIPMNVMPLGNVGVAEADDNDPVKLFGYTYMDTTPWNKTLDDEGTQLTGASNPIGFKGWFNFLKPRKTLTLNIRMMHARESKFRDGKASPYYRPSDAQKLSEHWDIDLKVPVNIAHARSEEAQWNEPENVTYDALQPSDKKMIQAIAEAYGISTDEALKAFKIRIQHAGHHEHIEGGLEF